MNAVSLSVYSLCLCITLFNLKTTFTLCTVRYSLSTFGSCEQITDLPVELSTN